MRVEARVSTANPAAERRLTVAIVMRDAHLRRLIRQILAADGVEVVVATADPLKLFAASDAEMPAVLVLGASEARSGLIALRRRLPDARIVVVGPQNDAGRFMRGVRRSLVDAVVLRSQIELALAATARAVFAEQVVFPRGLRPGLEVPNLSHRERQVLRLVVQGRTNDEIARALFLATSTVKSHLTSAFGKLSVSSRSEAAGLLLNPDEPVGRAVLGANGGSPPELRLGGLG